jgi:DNA polymerase sigma
MTLDGIKDEEAKDSEEEKKSAQDAMDAGSSSNSQFQLGSIPEKQQSSNILMLCERRFEPDESGHGHQQQPHFNAQPVFDKLHSEILDFRRDTKAIMAEMQLIKTQIIEKIREVITRAIPQSKIDVYGSHATKLCLHWSDIDLVLVPPSGSDNPDNWNNPLHRVVEALKAEEHSNWATTVTFIDQAHVPVIKMQCSFFDQALRNQTVSSAFKQPEGVTFKFLELLRKPINIDITLHSEQHNGLECVHIVR